MLPQRFCVMAVFAILQHCQRMHPLAANFPLFVCTFRVHATLTVPTRLQVQFSLETLDCACRQVRAVLAQAARTQVELEALFGKFLRAYPLLAPLGDKKTVKYVVWSVLAAPLLALLIPALLLPVSRDRWP